MAFNGNIVRICLIPNQSSKILSFWGVSRIFQIPCAFSSVLGFFPIPRGILPPRPQRLTHQVMVNRLRSTGGLEYVASVCISLTFGFGHPIQHYQSSLSNIIIYDNLRSSLIIDNNFWVSGKTEESQRRVLPGSCSRRTFQDSSWAFAQWLLVFQRIPVGSDRDVRWLVNSMVWFSDDCCGLKMFEVFKFPLRSSQIISEHLRTRHSRTCLDISLIYFHDLSCTLMIFDRLWHWYIWIIMKHYFVIDFDIPDLAKPRLWIL